MDHPLFFRLMCHSVDLLVALGGETTKVQALVRVMLSALLKYVFYFDRLDALHLSHVVPLIV